MVKTPELRHVQPREMERVLTEPDHAVLEVEHLMIPVGDGCRLSARLWMPGSAGHAFPAIVEMLPYRKRDRTVARDASTHPQFAQAGYACLRVDLRGCGESEGLFDDEYSEQELSDIEEVIAWIARQPWCSGAVGIMGISWGGFNGLQVAARRPPALKAVVTLCSTTDRFADDIHYKGGCQLTENIGWAATVMSWFSMPPDPALLGEDWRRVWLDRLENTPFLASAWLRHPTRDSYWMHGSVCEDFEAVEAAVLAIGGWHDGYRNTPVKLLEGGLSGPVKSIVGPWNHKYPHLATPEPRVDFVAVALRWWDRWLKDEPNGAEADPDYRVYVMDGVPPQTSYPGRPGRWLGLPRWPPDGIVRTSYFLGDGALGARPMSAPAEVSSRPECGRAFGEYFPFGFGPGELPDDQQTDDALSLCFDGAPLERDLTVLGAPSLRVSVAGDRRFGQIAARLCDVAPDGRSTLICLGLLDLRFRSGFETAVPLVPRRRYDIAVELDQAAYRVPAGHRLRLALSPGYWPFVWPEPGAVTLSISGGVLDLPILPDGMGDEIAFPPGPDTLPAATRTLREGSGSKAWLEENGRLALVIKADHGETLVVQNGLRMASALHEIWSIDTGEISDATAEILWERSLARDDWSVSTRVETRMRSDRDFFYVTMKLAAFEGETLVLEREFHDSVRRNPDNQQQENRERM